MSTLTGWDIDGMQTRIKAHYIAMINKEIDDYNQTNPDDVYKIYKDCIEEGNRLIQLLNSLK